MTSPATMRPVSRPAAGFTLLEVLVALVIVGTALGAGLRAVGSLTANSSGLRTSMMATWSAENRLVQIRLGKEFPEIGKRGFDCPQGDLHLVCQEEVIVSPNPRLRRVEVVHGEQAEVVGRGQPPLPLGGIEGGVPGMDEHVSRLLRGRARGRRRRSPGRGR